MLVELLADFWKLWCLARREAGWSYGMASDWMGAAVLSAEECPGGVSKKSLTRSPVRMSHCGTSLNAEIKLVVTGDDFGYCPRRDLGIVDCFRAGGVTNVSLLVNGSAAAGAADLARRYNIPIGLHANLSEGNPVCGELRQGSTLVNTEGVFLGKMGIRKALAQGLLSMSEIRQELQAQVNEFRELTGQDPHHMDGHQHVHILPNIREEFAQALQENGIRFTRLPVELGIQRCEWIPEELMVFNRGVQEDALNSVEIFKSYGLRWPDLYIGLSTMGKNMSTQNIQRAIEYGMLSIQSDLSPGCLPQTSTCVTIELMAHPGYPSLPHEGGCGEGPDDFSQSWERLHEFETKCEQAEKTGSEMESTAAKSTFERAKSVGKICTKPNFISHSKFLCKLHSIEDRYYVNVELQDNLPHIPSLLDTGSQVTLISAHYFEQVQELFSRKPRLDKSNANLVSVSGTSLKVLGMDKLDFKLGNKVIRHPTLVVDLPQNRLIIGMDLLKRLNPIIDFINEVIWSQVNVPISYDRSQSHHTQRNCHVIAERPDSIEVHFRNSQTPDISFLRPKPLTPGEREDNTICVPPERIRDICLENDVLIIHLHKRETEPNGHSDPEVIRYTNPQDEWITDLDNDGDSPNVIGKSYVIYF
uniref:Carbohydrate deacetylase n=1 Tax=Leptobrachium leishanense TaxID=445787 RepID=A0A8C5PD34_9ANUR